VKKLLIVALLGGNLLFAKDITIALAANVSYAIDDLIKEFNQKHSDTKVKVILGSSGKLTAQINNGAPFDMFLSANMKYPQALYKDGLSVDKPIVYAYGSLAYFSTKAQNFKDGIEFLNSPNIEKIAIANPKTAPYGKAGLEALKSADILKSVKSKLVYAESISHVVSYTMTAVDVGLVAKSSLFSSKMSRYKKDINWAEVNPKLYTPIKQGMVILKRTQNIDGAKAFYHFILSKEARVIFKKYGYINPTLLPPNSQKI